MVTVGKRPLELDPLPGVVLRYPDEVVDERLLAIGHPRVVLDVGVAGVLLDGVGGLALVNFRS